MPSSSRSRSEAMERAAEKSQEMLRRLSKGKKRRSTSTSGYSSDEGKCLNQARPKYPVTEAMKRARMKMQEKFKRVTQKAEKKKKKNEKRRQKSDGSGASSSKVKSCKSGDKNNNKEQKKQRSCVKRRRGRYSYPILKGKSYKTKDDREPKEISREKYFEKNYILSSKPSRSVRGGFSLRKLQDHRLGSGGRRRQDRPQSFEDHDEEERGCPPQY